MFVVFCDKLASRKCADAAAMSFGLSVREQQTGLNGGNMKKETRKDAEMRAHYDFSGGVRGKYARRYAEGTNVVVLDPDVACEFPNRDAMNKTLRAVAQIIQIQGRRRDRANKRTERTQKKRRSS
jgi:hypothetical protein